MPELVVRGVKVSFNFSEWYYNMFQISIGTGPTTYCPYVFVEPWARPAGATEWTLLQNLWGVYKRGPLSYIAGGCGVSGNVQLEYTDAVKGNTYDLRLYVRTQLEGETTTTITAHDFPAAFAFGTTPALTVVSGDVINAETNETLGWGSVTHVESGEGVAVGANGHYAFSPFIYFGEQNFTAEATGFESLTQPLNVVAGLQNKLNFTLTPGVAPPPDEPPPTPEPEPGTGTFYVRVFDVDTAEAIASASVGAEDKATFTDPLGWATFTDMTIPSTITYWVSAPSYLSSDVMDYSFSTDDFIAYVDLTPTTAETPGVMPWPFNLIQQYLQGLWNWVGEAASLAVQPVTNWINDGINTLWTWIEGGITWLGENVWEKIIWVGNQIYEGASWLANTVWDQVKGIWDKLVEGAEWLANTVWDQVSGLFTLLGEGIGWLWTNVNDAITGAQEFMETILHGALSGVATALGEGLQGFIEWFVGGITWFVEQLVNLATGAATWLGETFNNIITDIVNQIRQGLAPGSPPAEMEEALIGLGNEWQARVLDEITKATGSPIDYSQIAGVATGIAGIGLGVTGLALMLGTAADATHPLKEWGMKDTAKTILGYMGVSRTIAPLITVPYEAGVLKPLRYWFNSVYQASIPGVADIVRFYVREAATVPQLEYFEEGFANDLALLGFSRKWAEYFWTAHWIIPTYEQAREAYWRGILNIDEFEALRRYADLAPLYNNVWEGLQYMLPGRRDARWMYEWGTINRDSLRTLISYTGIDPKYLDDVTDAYIKNQLRDEIGRVRTVLVRLFIKGKITTEEELRIELTKLGIRIEAIDMTVTEAINKKWLAEKEETAAVKKDVLVDERNKLRTALLRLLIAEKIDEATVRSELSLIGYTDEEIEYTMKTVNYKKMLEGTELTKSDLIRGWELGVITDEDLIKGYQELGLNPADAATLATIQKRVALSSEIGLLRTETITDFQKGWINEDTLRTNLSVIGVPDRVIDYYVNKAKMRREREISEEWIDIYKLAFKKDQLTDVELAGFLTELGLQPDWVNVIVEEEKVRKGYAS